MMKKKPLYILFLISLLINFSCEQNSFHPSPEITHPGDSLAFVQIKTDSLFDSNQIISLLILPKDFYPDYQITLAYSKSDLYKTSFFADSLNALAAVNGGFFDMDSGGSVTYLEVGDSVISYTKSRDERDRRRNQLLNGAVVIYGDSLITFEPAQPDQLYEKSKKESAVLVTGPLLISDSEKTTLPDRKFVTDRHPRSCLGVTRTAIVVVAVDGRSEQAEGMSLPEAQSFLQDLGCTDAINLDGGGSTTLWINGKGIVNFPSDSAGERPVANAFLIMEK